MSVVDYYIDKIKNKVEKDFGNNEKWGLPQGYERKSLLTLDMDDDLKFFALDLEIEENGLMKRFKNEKAVKFVKTTEFGAIDLGVDFTRKNRYPQFVYGLTPTMLMFVVSHMSREMQAEEIYNPGYFKRFCEEYYERETNETYKKVVTPEIWNNAIDDAKNWLVENYNPMQDMNR